MNFTRLLPIALVLVASPAFTEPKKGPAGAITARIYDYARVERGQLQSAQQQVADIYRAIGVVIEWRDTARPAAIANGTEQWPTDEDAMFTIALITTGMAERVKLPPDVAGFAATDHDRGGRMAFIVVDRTQGIARGGRLFHFQVLGGVITHELAHLLLPRRSHSRSGIMRPTWSAADFASPGHQTFARDDAASIRNSVVALGTARARIAD